MSATRPMSAAHARKERARRAFVRRVEHQSLLFIYAHPDDESFLSAGTITHYRRLANTRIALVTATRGGAATRPPDADLLQVLWCPFDHEEHASPRTALFWRSAATVTDVLDAPPEPPIVQRDCYLPEPRLFSPEEVTDFPHPMELDDELRGQLDDMSRWETIDPGQYNAYADDPGELYLNNLCTAPGWKTGGWTTWGDIDPVDRPCPECGTEQAPLLTIASSEWDGIGKSWLAEEEPTNPAPPPLGARNGNFTLIDIVGGYNLQLYACPADPSHPHLELVQ